MTFSALRAAGALAALGLMAAAAPANAVVTFCNEFEQAIYVAIAYEQDGGTWLSRGWLSLDPHDCAPFDTALRLKTLYYRGESVTYKDAKGKRSKFIWGTEGRKFAIWEKDNFNYWNAEEKVLNSTLEPFRPGPTTDDPDGLDVTITFFDGKVVTTLKNTGTSGAGDSGQSHRPQN